MSEDKRFSSDEKRHVFNPAPQNDKEMLESCNALFATGDYPIITDGCFHVGMSGGCGVECYLYERGDCRNHQEMMDRLENQEEWDQYHELYSEEWKVNEELQRYARKRILEMLNECNPDQVRRFKQMYAEGEMGIELEPLTKNIPVDKLSWAMQQLINTKRGPIQKGTDQ